MNALQVFEYQSQQMRVIVMDGVPWCVARDVCAILELGDTRRAIERLDPDEWSLTPVTDSLGRPQKTYVVNEAGLFSLILGSRKEEARAFKRWVTHEVLPQIMKTGKYEAPEDPMVLIHRALEESRRLIEEQKKQIRQLAPKAEFYDQVAASKTAIDLRSAAKVLGIPGLGQNNLFKFLRDQKILDYKNQPMQEYINRGYFCVREKKWMLGDEPQVYLQTMVYQKGLDFIRRLAAERWVA